MSTFEHAALLQRISDGAVVLDSEGRVLEINPAGEGLLGYDAGGVVGRSLSDFFASDYQGRVLEHLRSKDEKLLCGSMQTSNGLEIPVEISFIRGVNGSGEMICLVKNTVQRNLLSVKLERESMALKAELAQKTAELVEKSKRLKSAEAVASLGHWDWDIFEDRLHWSDQIFRTFGVDPAEFASTYEAFLDLVHPEDQKKVELAVDQALQGGNNYNVEHRIIVRELDKNPEIRWVREKGSVIFDKNGNAARMEGDVLDITEQKTQEKLLQQQEFFKETNQDNPNIEIKKQKRTDKKG